MAAISKKVLVGVVVLESEKKFRTGKVKENEERAKEKRDAVEVLQRGREQSKEQSRWVEN